MIPSTTVGGKPRYQLIAPQSRSVAGIAKPAQPVQEGAAQRRELPGKYLTLEQRPISVFDDNPVFNEFGVAKLVGVSAEVLKKWRQRNMGPDYIQYGPAGPVRYEFNALMAFRASHAVKPGRER
jgi:hypothetical protein